MVRKAPDAQLNELAQAGVYILHIGTNLSATSLHLSLQIMQKLTCLL